MKQEISNTEHYDVNFRYAFSSTLGYNEHSRYINDVFQTIILTDEDNNNVDEIGHIHALMIYVDEASISPYGLFEVLDSHSSYLANHIFKVIDTYEGGFTKELEDYCEDLFGRNVCFIKEIKIKSKYRGMQIGAKAIKDLIFHYSSGFNLFVLQPFPLQFELKASRNDKIYELEKLEENEIKAKKKLGTYYKSMGFKSVKGIKDLLFYNPALINKKFDAIDMEVNPFKKE